MKHLKAAEGPRPLRCSVSVHVADAHIKLGIGIVMNIDIVNPLNNSSSLSVLLVLLYRLLLTYTYEISNVIVFHSPHQQMYQSRNTFLHRNYDLL